MKHFSSGLLFAILVVTAGTISAYSDRNAPTATSRLSGRADASANRPDGPFQGGRFTTVDVPGATATRLFAINDWGVAFGRYESAGRTHGFVRSATGELATIDFPGAGFTVAGALNNRGDIVGWYTLPVAPAVRHGFLLQDGQLTTFDPPGSTFTNALGINDRGDIVGRFCTITSFVCRQPGNGDFRGFLPRDAEFSSTARFVIGEYGSGFTEDLGASTVEIWGQMDPSMNGSSSAGSFSGAFTYCDGLPPTNWGTDFSCPVRPAYCEAS